MNCVVFATVEHLSRSPKDKDGEWLDCCSARSSAAPALLQGGLLLGRLQPSDRRRQGIESPVDVIETSVVAGEALVDPRHRLREISGYNKEVAEAGYPDCNRASKDLGH